MKVLLPVMLGCLLYSGGVGAQSAPAKRATPELWQSTLLQSWDWTGH